MKIADMHLQIHRLEHEERLRLSTLRRMVKQPARNAASHNLLQRISRLFTVFLA
jgi:uncharacterized protein YdhG (YjbR/CyaY superfamily)